MGTVSRNCEFCSSSSFTPCSACDSICETRTCDSECEGTPRCLEYEVAFEPVGAPEQGVLAACRRSFETTERCNWVAYGTGATHCGRFATLEDPEVAIAAYECIAGLTCTPTVAEAAACNPRPRHGLAEWFCAETASRGMTCNPDTRARLAMLDGWLLDSTADALRTCDGEIAHGIPFIECVASWIGVVEAQDLL